MLLSFLLEAAIELLMEGCKPWYWFGILFLGLLEATKRVLAKKREDSSLKDHSGYCADYRTVREKKLVEAREQF